MTDVVVLIAKKRITQRMSFFKNDCKNAYKKGLFELDNIRPCRHKVIHGRNQFRRFRIRQGRFGFVCNQTQCVFVNEKTVYKTLTVSCQVPFCKSAKKNYCTLFAGFNTSTAAEAHFVVDNTFTVNVGYCVSGTRIKALVVTVTLIGEDFNLLYCDVTGSGNDCIYGTDICALTATVTFITDNIFFLGVIGRHGDTEGTGKTAGTATETFFIFNKISHIVPP